MLSAVVDPRVRSKIAGLCGCRYNPNSLSRSPAERGFWHVFFQLPNPHRHATRPGGSIMATCPECDAEIEVDEFDVDKGDQLSCPECGSNLEVTAVSHSGQVAIRLLASCRVYGLAIGS